MLPKFDSKTDRKEMVNRNEKNGIKILILAHMFPSKARPLDGTFSFGRIQSLARYCQVKVITPKFWFPWFRIKGLSEYWQVPEKEYLGGVEVFYSKVWSLPKYNLTSFQSLSSFFSYWILLRQFRANFDFDLIHAYGACPSGFTAVRLGKMLHKPVVVTVEGGEIHTDLKYPFLRKLILYTLRNCDFITPVSEYLKNRMIRLGLTPHKMVAIPNGADFDRFRPMDQIPIRQKLNLPLNKKIILFLGTLRKTKGLLYLIPAIEQLMKKRQDFLFVLVGEGYLKQEIERQIRQLGLEPYVYLAGPCLHKTVPEWMNACDIFCLPSLNEGLSSVCIEASACGRPVVATKVGGIPEVVLDGQTGLLVEPRNPGQLVEVIAQLLDHPELCQRMGKAGRIRAAENYSWQQNAQRSINIYETVLSRFYHH